MNPFEEKILYNLPPELSEAVVKAAGLNGGTINEIRIRLNKPLVITVNDNNIGCGVICTREQIDEMVKRLCGNSMYSHLNTIREGYIDAGNGVRAGLCGQAVVENGSISVIKDITSLAIRIPRRVKGAADDILNLIRERDYHVNVLIYSKPGIGKTTVLRELAAELSSGQSPKRVAVVDTRSEICVGLEEAWMLDILNGYPRSMGIETAVRTLSPQYIIFDEIITGDDADAAITAVGSGVNLCASVHAESYETLTRHPLVRKLNEHRVFNVFVGLIPSKEKGRRYAFQITIPKG